MVKFIKNIQASIIKRRRKKIALMVINHPELGTQKEGCSYIGICGVLFRLTVEKKITSREYNKLFWDLSSYYKSLTGNSPMGYWFRRDGTGKQERIDFLNDYIDALHIKKTNFCALLSKVVSKMVDILSTIAIFIGVMFAIFLLLLVLGYMNEERLKYEARIYREVMKEDSK